MDSSQVQHCPSHEKTLGSRPTPFTIAAIAFQAAQIQKVSAQLEARKPAPQVVDNP